MLNLGLAIKTLRKVTKTSQRKLASEVDVTVTHISHIENNKADPSINLLRKIASALGVSIETLFFKSFSKHWVKWGKQK